MSNRIDLSGQQFGFVKVLSISHKDLYYKYYWNCLCICGKYCIIRADVLKSSNVSCGCKTSFIQSQKATEPEYSANINRILRQYKKRGIQSGKGYSLSRNDFKTIILSNCFYCGSEPSNCCIIKTKFKNNFLMYNGIDRVDSAKGYSKENCVPCCATCNIAKNDLSVRKFFEWIKKVFDYSVNNDILRVSDFSKEEI